MSSTSTVITDAGDVVTPSRLHPLVRGMVWAFPAVLAGGWLLAEANRNFDALVLSVCVLILGFLVSSIPGLAETYAQRAFLLTYGSCVLAAGLCQVHSMRVFGEPLNFVDAVRFYELIPREPPYLSPEEWRGIVKGALAMYFWQEWYALFRALGFEHGPYVGVLANCFIMGLSAILGLRAAAEVFGPDEKRLSLVGVLFALCGSFLLLGAILIRDCFIVLITIGVFWSLLRTLKKPTTLRVGTAAVCVGIGIGCMAYLRFHAAYMFLLIAALAVGSYYWERRETLIRMALLTILAIGAMVAYSQLERIVGAVGGELAEREETYLEFAALSSSEDSLGLRYVVNQPLPIRIGLGSFVLLAFPIPFWALLRVGDGGYVILQTYHALYQLLVVPLGLAGAVVALRQIRSKGESQAQMLFLFLFTAVSHVAVVYTSREGRHFAPFYVGLLILACLPDREDPRDRFWLRWMRIGWVGLVALAHVAWALARS